MLKCKFRVYSFYTLYNLLNMSTKNGSATLPWGSAGNRENPHLVPQKISKIKKTPQNEKSPVNYSTDFKKESIAFSISLLIGIEVFSEYSFSF